MKSKSILICMLAMAMTCVIPVSCSSNKSTELLFTVAGSTPTKVGVIYEGLKIDTVLSISDGKASFSLPVDKINLGYVVTFADAEELVDFAQIISDGSSVEVNISEEGNISLTTQPGSLMSEINSFYTMSFEGMSESEYYEFVVDFAKRNSDNGIALLALSLIPDEASIIKILDSLKEPVSSHEYVTYLRNSIDSRSKTAPGSKFVDFEVEHVYGYDRSADPQPLKKVVKFSDYVGQGAYVLVDFWSPWCGPCRQEIKNIKPIYEKYKNKGLEVLSIAVWEREPQSHTIEVAGQLGMDWKHINNAGTVPTDIYGIDGIPHLMLIGPDGTILERGFHGAEEMEEVVSKYIK